ncbi:tRNA lysidine(34) synthetase TilS [Pseudaminobacter sp. NGMCC 1.201702]|uniref:tRNA lysidine(34) synthetase TilS n=1 Tax=Pseudaminobacter sp. NGMCC 1.201702 TaxID=3391825 RepID=UPI0039EDEA1C
MAIDPVPLLSRYDFASRSAVIAAVSGGSDSLALLFLLKSFLDNCAPTTRLVAVTVDHALRQGSGEEAASVARLAARHGITHRIMSWRGQKPATGIPAAARRARYELLAQAARLEGTDLIFTGHTADDQAETVLMRQARGQGRGLAGMAPVTLFDGAVWIVRPLLTVRREALRDFLRLRGVDWLDDPTNTNQTFERPRLRATLKGDSDTFRAAFTIADAAAGHRIRLGIEAAALIRTHAGSPAPGLVRLDHAFSDEANREAAIYAWRILLACVGGASFLPDEARAASVFDRLGGPPFCATLSRAVIDKRSGGIFLHREARDLPDPAPPRDGALWDGRYRLRVEAPAAGLVVAPMGPENAAKAAFPPHDAPQSLVRRSLAGLPALWRGETCLGPLPGGIGSYGVAATALAAPWASFLPSFDLAPARVVTTLLGGPELPDPPLAGHNERKA